jgi:hypothetical protein
MGRVERRNGGAKEVEETEKEKETNELGVREREGKGKGKGRGREGKKRGKEKRGTINGKMVDAFAAAHYMVKMETRCFKMGGGVVLVRFDLETVEEERITDNQGGYRRDVWCRKWSSRSRRWPRSS